MQSKIIEAVVFDLDGVITDTAKYHYLAWKSIADERDIPFNEEFNENLKGVSRLESLELILNRGNIELTYAEKMELAEKKNELYKQFIQQLTPEEILPGILSFINRIKSENIPIGLASVSKNAQTVLQALEIEHLFDYCADASKIKNSKPDPEIFLNVCDVLQANPSNAIGIEDALVGIAAIQSSNMFAVGIGGHLTDADLLVEETSQLDWNKVKEAFSHWKES
ncbi:beta-phosphoglucomutase [Bacillus sp. SD088]|uniref:beta-phosphoglucomutase n=1 Tax=Bacillus sp. SD088 TaxID=2782012 RepID=UPI001A9697D7|nr:beta-phosphoglucomutase [Bacillus sp. SD088]MBO0995725.1 beta-phosphoglucomutase [Bacillus sp. SD088]